MTINTDFHLKKSDFHVTSANLETEWLKAKIAKEDKITKIALLCLSIATFTLAIAFSVALFVTVPELWPIGLAVMGCSILLFCGYLHQEIAPPAPPSPLIPDIPDARKKNEKLHSKLGYLDLPFEKKEKNETQKCMEKYGLDSSQKPYSFDINSVTFTSVAHTENCEMPYGIIRKAPPCRYLICEGGGSRGISLPSFVRGLNARSNVLEGLKEVAGVSAGSIFTSLLAAGIPVKHMEKLIAETPFESLLGDSQDECVTKECLTDPWGGYYSGTKMAEFIHTHIRDSITKYYNSLDESGKSAMKKKFGSEFETYKQGVTFKHLRWMHELNPVKFKRLHVVVFDRYTKKPYYFDDMKTPDDKVFFAVRASMSIPKVFAPLIGKNGTSFTDGGEISNMPTEIFSSQEEFNPAELLQLAFDRNGETFRILHNQSVDGIAAFIKDFFKQLFVGAHFVAAEHNDLVKKYNIGSHTLVVPHGMLSTINFWVDRKTIKLAQKQALKAGKKYGKKLRSEAIHQRYKTIEDAASSLSNIEKLFTVTSDAYKIAAQSPDLSKPEHQFFNAVKPFALKTQVSTNF